MSHRSRPGSDPYTVGIGIFCSSQSRICQLGFVRRSPAGAFYSILEHKRQGSPCRLSAAQQTGIPAASIPIRTNATKPVLFCCVRTYCNKCRSCQQRTLVPCVRVRVCASTKYWFCFVCAAASFPCVLANPSYTMRPGLSTGFLYTLRLPAAARRRRVLLSSCLSASA